MLRTTAFRSGENVSSWLDFNQIWECSGRFLFRRTRSKRSYLINGLLGSIGIATRSPRSIVLICLRSGSRPSGVSGLEGYPGHWHGEQSGMLLAIFQIRVQLAE